MKKILTLCLLIIMIANCAVPVLASDHENVIWSQETELDNGIIVIDEVIDQSQMRSSTKDYTRRKTLKDGDTVIAVISIRGVFSYNGTTVSVTSKKCHPNRYL